MELRTENYLKRLYFFLLDLELVPLVSVNGALPGARACGSRCCPGGVHNGCGYPFGLTQ